MSQAATRRSGVLLVLAAQVVVLGAARPATAAEPPGATPVTVAALPPERTAGRGARVPFVEHEAEAGLTDGELIGPDRTFATLAAEASGRRAVRLDAPGEFVEVVLDRPADAVTLRYALPDSADGRGLDGEIALYADGRRLGALKLTSRYSWYYGAYPFTNRPADGTPHHFYDESRLLLGEVLPAGTRVRFVVEADGVPWRVLDLADFELVGPAPPPPANALSVVDFGADPSGATEASRAFDAAIAAGRRTGRPVWIPPGEYRIERHLEVDEATLVGAGAWRSVLKGDGVGVYGRKAPGGSREVTLKDFAIIGEVRERKDKAQLAGVGGAMSDSTISGLWIQHTKVGLWFDGPMRGVVVRNVRVLDQAADGLNFHRGVTDALVEDVFVRNSGDDGLAAWSHEVPNARLTFRHNSVIAPTLANGIAIYGGQDVVVTESLVADTLTQGGGLHLGARFSATPFAGRVTFRGNTTVRAGVMDPNWGFGVGALWLYALDRPIEGADIRILDTDLIDSTYEAVQVIGERPISGVGFNGVRIRGAGSHAVQLQAPGAATFREVRADGLGAAGVYDCGAGFRIERAEGNAGWETVDCPRR
ncbi:glycosyl hydrolase family 28-related protein [Caulobacter sp. 17J80-11]|uniref:glycosyl hydrolase family 28-related protein n=1 Tax=Caulobacter sp. 17J80-11 TaxID=2763502 RepID=UPI001653E84E|nr:glycosyl hydrolase family 28-related protein [Caulobacter sp. 17J80-11]MBC6983412.1 mycodextranase [Caulobacter sp. 17J80-11]